MKTISIKYCPSTLAEGFESYSPSALRKMFDGRKVSPILPFESPQTEEVQEAFQANRKRISISGVQEKLGVLLDKNKLRLAEEGEQNTYILKPIPRDLKKVNQVPANEHLTMQIARQVFDIPTAENALVFFQDGTPAYLTKRFDIGENSKKIGMEDFASLAGMSVDTSGTNFKYDYNYELLGMLFQKYCPAWRIEIEKYFRLVLFNYLCSNGDAHLKNFSILESPQGDYLLSPAYDLINTRIHVDDTDFALKGGLFEDDYKSEEYKKNSHPSATDFQELAKRIGILPTRVNSLIQPFLKKNPLVKSLVNRSYLNEASKRTYFLHYETRLNYLIA